MFNLIVFSVIFLILFSFFIKISTSFFQHLSIRKKLKKGLRANKAEIRRNKGYENGQYQIYQHIYNSIVLSTRRKRSNPKFEQRVNSELNRMVKNPFTRLFSKGLSFIKGAMSFVLLLMTLFFGSLVYDEYKLSNLTLPTVDPNIQLKMNLDFDEIKDKLMSTTFGQQQNLPSFTYDDIEADAIEPVYLNEETYPDAISNVEQLGQAFAYHLSQFETEFAIQYTGETSDFSTVIDDTWEWLEENEVYLSRTRGESRYQYRDYGDHIELNVTMSYHLTAEENAIVQGMVQEIAAAAPANLSDVEKVKYVNDYIVKHTKYNLDSVESPYTPYSILVNGEGVCQGYALTALLLLEELNVDVRYISGDALPGGPHAWNLVKLDGEWYHLDTTWNDPVPDQGNNVRYDYFLLADAKIAKDHQWDTSDYPASAAQNY